MVEERERERELALIESISYASLYVHVVECAFIDGDDGICFHCISLIRSVITLLSLLHWFLARFPIVLSSISISNFFNSDSITFHWFISIILIFYHDFMLLCCYLDIFNSNSITFNWFISIVSIFIMILYYSVVILTFLTVIPSHLIDLSLLFWFDIIISIDILLC